LKPFPDTNRTSYTCCRRATGGRRDGRRISPPRSVLSRRSRARGSCLRWH